jgi:hypothetical protein
MVTSVWSDAILVPHSTNKTTPHDCDCQYGDPPSKYGPTGHMYDSTNYGMESTTEALT